MAGLAVKRVASYSLKPYCVAKRSADAAHEIKALISTSVDKVESGARQVQDAGTTMDEIVGSVQRVGDIIGEITAAASEQSDGIGQVNTAVNQLDQMTQQNAALVEHSADAAQSLREQATRLAGAVQVFKLSRGDAAATQGGLGYAPARPWPRPWRRPATAKGSMRPAAACGRPSSCNRAHPGARVVIRWFATCSPWFMLA